MPMHIEWIGCALENFRKGRPPHLPVEAVVVHVMDGSQQACDETFLSRSLDLKRSAHYSISRSGTIHQYVDERDTAFHCGIVDRPTWQGIKRGPSGALINPNFYTIGIEHEGRADDPWPDEMYAASAELLGDIASRYPALRQLSRRTVVMHREIRASKSCPGTHADLSRLILAAGGAPAEDPQVVRARSRVNVRRGQPSRLAPIVRIIPAGEPINVTAKVTGEAVDGISVWYQNMDDDFIWSGAVAR
jgi:N-acetyl-anhydromuramyl-L-alanine amidase AmpD